MYKTVRIILSVLLSIVLLQGSGLDAAKVFATQSKATVAIEFTGDEAALPGFAQSKITVTPVEGGKASGYYLVYYTDGAAVLPDYDEALVIRAKDGSKVTGEITDGKMLPADAKGIAVFESETPFMETTPDIKNAVATAPIPENKLGLDLGSLEFSFGAISDTHMNYEQHNRGAYAKLRNTMDFFAGKEMDMVLIAGDATGDRGETPDLDEQYEKHVEIIKGSAYPFEKVYEAIGNHGNTAADRPLLAKYLGGSDEVHPFENSPYFHVLQKGEGDARDNLFIFMAQELTKPGESADRDNFSKAQIDWLEKLLEEYEGTDTNLFIVIHAPFLSFGAGDISGGSYKACITFKTQYAQNQRLKALLKTYKNAVVMSGHTHTTFYDDANYSDISGAFARTVHISSNSQPCGYGTGSSRVVSFDGRREVTPEYGSEGYTVAVYSDYIVYTGYNFSTGKKIPDACLILPVMDYPTTEKESTPSSADTEKKDDSTSAAPVTSDAPDALSGETSSPALWIILGVLAVLLVAGGIAFFLIKKKK